MELSKEVHVYFNNLAIESGLGLVLDPNTLSQELCLDTKTMT